MTLGMIFWTIPPGEVYAWVIIRWLNNKIPGKGYSDEWSFHVRNFAPTVCPRGEIDSTLLMNKCVIAWKALRITVSSADDGESLITIKPNIVSQSLKDDVKRGQHARRQLSCSLRVLL